MKLSSLMVALAIGATQPMPAIAEPSSSAPAQNFGVSQLQLKGLDRLFSDAVATGDLPGAVVAVFHDGKLYEKSFGYRDATSRDPMTLESIFRIYSLSKPLTVATAMTLAEQGRLNLNAPVSLYLHEFAGQQVKTIGADGTSRLAPVEREMTVLDLMRHTSGLGYAEIIADQQIKDAYAAAGVFDPEQPPFVPRNVSADRQVAGLARAPLLHQPGTVWEYSLSTDMLGRVVERVAGKRLGEAMHERLLAPIGMRDTGFVVPPANHSRIAQPFAGGAVALFDPTIEPQNDAGGSGAVSTVRDYMRFARLLLDGGTIDGKRVLGQATVDTLMANSLGSGIRTNQNPGTPLNTQGFSYALGMGVRVANGDLPGSQGLVMWSGFSGPYFWVDRKERLAAVVMIQAPDKQIHYARETMRLVYEAISTGRSDGN